jgi:hypothetical protein
MRSAVVKHEIRNSITECIGREWLKIPSYHPGAKLFSCVYANALFARIAQKGMEGQIPRCMLAVLNFWL